MHHNARLRVWLRPVRVVVVSLGSKREKVRMVTRYMQFLEPVWGTDFWQLRKCFFVVEEPILVVPWLCVGGAKRLTQSTCSLVLARVSLYTARLAGAAQGYMSPSQFVGEDATGDGPLLYSTRDCVQQHPCGGFVFAGRSDDLVKVGGV